MKWTDAVERVGDRDVRVRVLVEWDEFERSFAPAETRAEWDKGYRPFVARVLAPDGREWESRGYVSVDVLGSGSWPLLRRCQAEECVEGMLAGMLP